MNNQRHNNNHRQNHQQQNNSYQHNSYQNDPNRWERQNLEREQRQLNRQLSLLDARIDALGAQGAQLEADIRAHDATIPATVAAEAGRAILNALRFPHLPSAARGWYYKRERMLQIRSNLKHQAIILYHQRESLVQQIEQVQAEIELLKYNI